MTDDILLQEQVARDHLVMCSSRLALARIHGAQVREALRSFRSFLGDPDHHWLWLERGFSMIEVREREADLLRALDFVWEAQERAKVRTTSVFFGLGVVTADEAREVLLERADRGEYDVGEGH